MPYRLIVLAAAVLAAAPLGAQQGGGLAFGTLREQAALQQAWLRLRLDRQLLPLMREYGVGCWVIPMREYNEDPTFPALVAPTTFAARRRTIYLFCDRGPQGLEKIALGGSDQGGVYVALRSARPAPGGGSAGRTAELMGDQQWQLLRDLLVERDPATIAVNRSRTFAFADGLTAAEWDAMREALGDTLVARVKDAEGLAVDFLALRLPEEEAIYRQLQQIVWEMIGTMFSRTVIIPGETRTSDLVWWWREETRRRGLTTWFQPSITVQRAGATSATLGDDPVILPGDLLWCDVGLVALGLHTDTQHNAYVLKAGETDAPAGLRAALAKSNRLQDILFEAIRPGRTGNEVLAAARAMMQRDGITGTIYSHPIGLNGHGAGPLIGLWDNQDGVPGRGDHRVRAGTWFSSELQATVAIPEWGGQEVRMAQEEDFLLGADGWPRWFHRRQSSFHLVR